MNGALVRLRANDGFSSRLNYCPSLPSTVNDSMQSDCGLGKRQAYDCVFSTALGGPLSVRNVVQTLHNLQTTLELRQQRFHDLRHATANLLLGPGGGAGGT